MTKRTYSKSSEFYTNAKKSFFEQNETLLRNVEQQNILYASQPIRKNCKICNSGLADRTDFSSHGVPYIFCDHCQHLNGHFEDTKDFVEKLYISGSGDEYAKNYIDPDYEARTKNIYTPKLDFLSESLSENAYTVLDVGCGAGYFVAACKKKKVTAEGIDVSEKLVTFGNQQLEDIYGEPDLLATVPEKQLFVDVKKTDKSVISAIGVIEHLRHPLKLFEAFNKSKAEFLFYTVPMFSMTVIFENIFSEIFPRHLSGGHTHLFTENSIAGMHRLGGVKSISEWRFGTDVMDLYRSINIKLRQNKASPIMLKMYEKPMKTMIDDLQKVMDKSHFCSELHCVVTKK